MKFKIIYKGKERETEFSEGMNILESLRAFRDIHISAPCGGKGTCGKCTVELEADGVRKTVLACRTPAQEGSVVYIASSEDEISVAESGSPEGASDDASDASAGHERVPAAPDEGLSGFGIACDIGTTTVVCRLIDLCDGSCPASCGRANAQRSFGSDVIARIVSAGEGHLEELTSMIRAQINEMTAEVCAEAGIEISSISRMAVAGNPTMCHLFAGLDPDGIGKAPFTTVSLFGDTHSSADLGLAFDGEVYILPSISAYIGGDITGDLISSGMDHEKDAVLLVDVGTNGEMAIGCEGRFISCSTAAGPAFEGAQISCGMTAAPGAISAVTLDEDKIVCSVIGGTEAKGICGSGLIDAVAAMLDLGAIDETGKISNIEDDDEEDICPEAAPYLFLTEKEEPAFRLTENVYITQGDIRRFQLGKGAISAGIKVLTKKYGIAYENISALLLAGGFGSFIRPESAARTGLIPKKLLPVTRAIGNAAVEGAADALVSTDARKRLVDLVNDMEYYELSGDDDFADAYMDCMFFPL